MSRIEKLERIVEYSSEPGCISISKPVSNGEIMEKVNEIIDWINQVDGKVIKCESVQNLDTAQKLEEALKLLREFTNLDYAAQTEEFNEIVWKVDSFLQKIGRSVI